MQIIVPDKVGLDNWWKECKTRRAPKETGGLTTDITNRLPTGVKLGRKTTANLGKIMKKSARLRGRRYMHAPMHTHTHTRTHTHNQLAYVQNDCLPHEG